MAPDVDPYRTLGLSRDATPDEVRRAYRRLAKANHPDAAGEAALPRFLAIRAAYDQILGPGAADGGPGARAAGSAGSRRAWDADPSRADATRRAYGRGARRPRGANSRGGSGTGPASGEGSRSSRPPRPPREPNRATPGSTSYDGAEAEPFEPDWGGASWYGTTSGTYWTLNPKEYADPRKHGPEYQARARRAAEAAEAAAGEAGDAAAAVDAPSAAEAPVHTTTSWWEATAGTPAAEPPPESSGMSGPSSANAAPGDSPEPARWRDVGSGGQVGRVGRAVAGWIPVALGIGWLTGEVSGCARFAADCDPLIGPVTWLAQIVALVVLLLVPRLAVVATVAAVGTLAAAVPGALILASTGAGADPGSLDGPSASPSGAMVLGVLLVLGWLVGLAVGLWHAWRGRPVS